MPIIPPILALGPVIVVSVLRLDYFFGPAVGTRHTWINRKEEPTLHLSELLVQILPPNARLNNNVHIILVELHDLVHEGKINTDASERRREVSFQTGSSRIRNDRYPVLVAYACDC